MAYVRYIRIYYIQEPLNLEGLSWNPILLQNSNAVSCSINHFQSAHDIINCYLGFCSALPERCILVTVNGERCCSPPFLDTGLSKDLFATASMPQYDFSKDFLIMCAAFCLVCYTYPLVL